MAFPEDQAADAVLIMAEQGESFASGYTAFGSSAVTFSGIWDPTGKDPENPGEGRMQFRRGELQVLSSAFATPDTRDLFTIYSVVYAVESVEQQRWITRFRLIQMDQHRSGGNPVLAET